MKRQIYNELMVWKNRKDRKPLVILGARQVGKTWIMRHFGKQEYENVAYITATMSQGQKICSCLIMTWTAYCCPYR